MSARSAKSVAGVDSTWSAQPTSNDWTTAANWNPAQVPTGTATFGATSIAGVDFAASASASVENIVFAAGAPFYTFIFNALAPDSPTLTITGVGVSNYSAIAQRVVVASSAQNYKQPQLKFMNAASAGGSDMNYYAGPATPDAAGGGVIGFYNTASAGSALFTVTTGAGTPPDDNSTVGGEVSFSDSSSAGTARFTIYGSTSPTDGDTFGNTVFHDTASAASAVFTNIGGTVAGSGPKGGGDGGNTQFYDSSTAASGVFHNMGATANGANGGDVAFDGASTAANGQFHNYAAAVSGGHGGVTSFNNNKPYLPASSPGASAGNGVFYNYGASASGQGGGHTSFSGKFGSGTGGEGTFVNYGSAVAGSASSAGHTIFSVSLPNSDGYSPDAANGVFWNMPGTASDAPGGYTQFTVYSDDRVPKSGAGSASGAKGAASTNGAAVTNSASSTKRRASDKIASTTKSGSGVAGPTAATATCVNVGALVQGAYGGQTSFSGTSSAAQSKLLAMGGLSGCEGGRIAFYDAASGGAASVALTGNGTLDIGDHAQPGVTIGSLELAHGVIEVTIGSETTCLTISGSVTIEAAPVTFSIKSGDGFAAGTAYTVLSASNPSSFSASQFTSNELNGLSPTFSIAGNDLQVTYNQ